jgi:hypothetical protein
MILPLTKQVNKMDNETRGFIEKELDKIINSLSREDSTKDIVEWIMSDLVDSLLADYGQEIKSSEDLAVGYVLGYLARVCHQILLDKKWKNKMKEITSSEKFKESRDKTFTIYLKITNKDANEVREIIKPKIPRIREEVIKALNA